MTGRRRRKIMLSFVLSVVACQPPPGSGALSFRLVWLASADAPVLLADMPSEIKVLRLTVTSDAGVVLRDDAGRLLTKDYAVDERTLVLGGIPPTTGAQVTLAGLNAALASLYFGSRSGVRITDNAVTALGVITMTPSTLTATTGGSGSSSGGSTSGGSSTGATSVTLPGAGTAAAPYLISTASELLALSNLCGTLSAGCASSYQLTTDIDLSATIALTAIGTSSAPFAGTFDGNGKTIKGVTIAASTSVNGLFSYLAAGGQIKNLTLTKVNVAGQNDVGALVGISAGTISNVSVAGNVAGKDRVGGLVGTAQAGSQISGSVSTADVSASVDRAGGLIGVATDAVVTSSSASGTITSAGVAGGLVAEASGSSATSFTSCAANGSVTATSIGGGLIGNGGANTSIVSSSASGAVTLSSVSTSKVKGGGLVGAFAGTKISRSYASGKVTVSALLLTASDSGFGGLVGLQSSGDTSDAYATGATSGANGGPAGGLIGNMSGGTVARSYAVGAVSIGTAKGGFIGSYSGGTFADNYWDQSATGITDAYKGAGGSVSGITGGSTVTLQSSSTFANWDFTGIWSINNGFDYPKLR